MARLSRELVPEEYIVFTPEMLRCVLTDSNNKDWIVKMYNKYEVNNPEYQSFKNKKIKT